MEKQGARLAKRLGTLLSGLLECMCFAGVIFGWASLVYVLKDMHYFEELCVPAANGTGNGTQGPDCRAQDEQLSLVFTIGSFMNNFMTFPTGYIFDRFGTMPARLLAISFYTGGTLLIAFSTAATALILFPAMCLLSIGGILLILTNMQVGNLFGKHRSTIITLYNGAFDSSSAVFLVVKLLYEQGLTLRATFLFLSACSAWHLTRTFCLMPRWHIPYPLPPGYAYGLRCRRQGCSYRTHEEQWPGLGDGTHEPSDPCSEPGLRGADAGKAPMGKGESGAGPGHGEPPGMSFRACVFSKLFFWHLMWLSVMQLRHYLFIGTLNPTLEHLAARDTALALWGPVRPLEWAHLRPTQAWEEQGWQCQRWLGLPGRPALLRPVAGCDSAAVCSLLGVRLCASATRAVRHLHPAGAEPLLPVWGQRRLPGHRVPAGTFREALWAGDGPVSHGVTPPVPLLCTHQGTAQRRPLLCEHWPHHRHPPGLRQSAGGAAGVPAPGE
ncbi:solute carrier family 43 member 3 isoform X3 [Gopherus evgoodei]|uniref:solute carrier family 43 member 3 isoform X3 n=1 Tax=Gopherus evgoodei TaxID=1825980 RepID=UPI0011CFB860|nr:solute carrier family 43 member 3 isoform X3 [Gopherus evgoodei]